MQELDRSGPASWWCAGIVGASVSRFLIRRSIQAISDTFSLILRHR